jgi:folylpolyglutamate synthase/dihydropteroate synthase
MFQEYMVGFKILEQKGGKIIKYKNKKKRYMPAAEKKQENSTSGKISNDSERPPSVTVLTIGKKNEDEGREFHIFVTGSLHLIGNVLSVLDPDLTLATS